MRIKRKAAGLRHITALMLLLAVLSVFLALPFHHCAHSHAGEECRLCLLASGLRSEGPAAAANSSDITEYCREADELLVCMNMCFTARTLTSLKTKMNN
ncbi:MAG: hypothetical protein K6E42_07365 [Synergistes sp.]|nr:hypothetical protein [Synergistes sp.]